MFTEETLKNDALMKDEWERKVAKMGASGYTSRTVSGFEVNPVYSPGDMKDIPHEDIPLPGEYPYTRGYWPIHHQLYPPIIGQQMSLGSTEETVDRIEYLKKVGRHSRVGIEDESFCMALAIDLPSQTGYDPDDPEASGKVGECAMSLSTMDDFIELYKGMPTLDKVPTVTIAFNSGEVCCAMYAVYCMDHRKEPLSNLRLFPGLDHLCQHYYDIETYPPQAALKMRVDAVKWLVENCPNSAGAGQNEGYNVGEAGAVPSFEMAVAFTQALEVARECQRVGMNPDDFMGAFFSHFHLGINIFEEVAKLRAARRMWAKIAKEQFGCTNPKAMKLMEIITQNSAYDTIALEPLNNIIRITIMTLGGFLGDLDAIHPISYDEPLGIPNDEALLIAQRTMQILAEETDIPYVTDPLGGSYYVESLTNRMEEEIVKNMKKIEDMGGFIKCLESGWIRSEVARQAAEKMRKVASGEMIKVGFNKYKIQDSPPPIKVIRRPDELEERVVAKVKEYKKNRDQEKVKNALAELTKAATAIDKDWPDSVGVLMPTLIETIRAKATLGECCRVFRDVFGYGYFAG